MSDIKLYTFALSPYGLKVQCYLSFLQLDFQIVYVDPIKMRQELPVGRKVPVLSIDGEARNESTQLGLWLDEKYPLQRLVPQDLKVDVMAADDWVTHRLIPHLFRDAIGYDDPPVERARKRLKMSKVLDQTSPRGLSLLFRLLHLLFIGRTFVGDQVSSTDTASTLPELKQQLAGEFEKLLGAGPFLAASEQPTLADLSAYPQIVIPRLLQGEDYFLPGGTVQNWVDAVEQAVPGIHRCLPAIK